MDNPIKRLPAPALSFCPVLFGGEPIPELPLRSLLAVRKGAFCTGGVAANMSEMPERPRFKVFGGIFPSSFGPFPSSGAWELVRMGPERLLVNF